MYREEEHTKHTNIMIINKYEEIFKRLNLSVKVEENVSTAAARLLGVDFLGRTRRGLPAEGSGPESCSNRYTVKIKILPSHLKRKQLREWHCKE